MNTTVSCDGGCSEYRALERRTFMQAAGRLGTAALISSPAWLGKMAFAADEDSARDLIVCIFLRGAADGLTLCVPHGDDAYYAARPTLSVPRPDVLTGPAAIDLDGFFGLPPAFAKLKPIYDAGDLAIVHAAGSKNPTRSHFEAQDFMENGTPGDGTTVTGWLGRHLLGTTPAGDSGFRGLAASYSIPRALAGAPATVALPSLEEYGLLGRPETNGERLDLISRLYQVSDEPLRSGATNIAATIDLLGRIEAEADPPPGDAVYPDGEWGRGLRTIAKVAEADVGLEAACIDLGGWDTHAGQGSVSGRLDTLMTEFADGLAAFHADLSDKLDRTTIVVMSEFGRRVAENGSAGTDHGHGNAMFIVGGHVDGGRVHGDWPGLHPDQRDNERDLAITTDFRDVLGEILRKRTGRADFETVFPGFSPTDLGVLS